MEYKDNDDNIYIGVNPRGKYIDMKKDNIIIKNCRTTGFNFKGNNYLNIYVSPPVKKMNAKRITFYLITGTKYIDTY